MDTQPCLTCLSRLAVLTILALGLPMRAADWTRFRGPLAAGIAEAENPPAHFGPASNVVWQTESPRGHSSPVILKNRIFLTGSDANKMITLCLDRLTGKTLWEQSVTAEKLEPIHQVNSHATPTPVTDGKAVYAYFGSFGLLAYDLDGKEIWRKALPTPKTFFNQGTGTSPVLSEDKLLVFVQVGADSHLLALNPADGREIWKAPMPIFNNSYSTPVVWQENEKTFAGLSCATRFTAFSVDDGKEAWSLDGLGRQACATPTATSGRLIITVAGVQGEVSNMIVPPSFEEVRDKYDRDGDGLVAFDELPDDFLFTDRQAADGKGNMPMKQALGMFGGVKKGDKLNRDRWEQIRSRLVSFRQGDFNRTVVLSVRTDGKADAAASRVLWKETKGVPEVPSPLVWRDRIYLIRSGGILVCRDLKSGKLIYENRTDSRGGYFASPVLASGRIYLASDRGTVTVVKAGDAFEVLARNELDDPIIASPAIVANTLYVRSAKRLWAFAGKAD